jgi:hypothetical protein
MAVPPADLPRADLSRRFHVQRQVNVMARPLA